jgi:predicted ATPase
MNFRQQNFYIITGGPGVGKTTLLNELEKSGFKTVPEDARQIIKEQMAKNGDGLPWKNKELYTGLMLKAAVESYKLTLTKNSSSIYFFDRGILDTLCYANMIGLGISDEMESIAKTHLYNKKVFVLPPWIEIYQTDSERKQTWEEAIFTFKKMRETYVKYGYEVIEVPKETVENRRNYILEKLNPFVQTGVSQREP